MGPFRRAHPALCAIAHLTSALWPNTSFVRELEEIAALKQQPGRDIYLVGALELRRALSMPAGG